MNRWNPCSRQDFIRRLSRLGFDGPHQGSRHQYMTVGLRRLTIPSNRDYSVHQVRMLLRQVEERLGRGLTIEEWNSLS